MNITSRQKEIASASCPLVGGFASKAELKLARKVARGKYWDDKDWAQFVAFSPKGYRKYFDYDDDDKKQQKLKAKKYAQGK